MLNHHREIKKWKYFSKKVHVLLFQLPLDGTWSEIKSPTPVFADALACCVLLLRLQVSYTVLKSCPKFFHLESLKNCFNVYLFSWKNSLFYIFFFIMINIIVWIKWNQTHFYFRVHLSLQLMFDLANYYNILNEFKY